jgi:DNA polymerase-3 subunit gamma/tau
LSRCQQLEFKALPTSMIAAHLEAVAAEESFSLEPRAAELIARAASGSVRDGLSFLDQLRAFSADDISAADVAEVLGLPLVERTLALIAALAEARLTEAQGLLADELGAGHDPWVIGTELARTLKSLLDLTLGAAEAEALFGAHGGVASSLAEALGVDGLSRMLGLWLDQETMLKSAANRELALQVACLRLGRWPSVRRLEALLSGAAGSTAVAIPRIEAPPIARAEISTTSTRPADASSQATIDHASGPAGRLAELLSQAGHEPLAGILEQVLVERHGSRLRVELRADQEALRPLLEREDSRAALALAVRSLFGEDLELELSAGLATATTADLRDQALSDPGVQRVQELIGGRLGEVEPDR